MSKVNFEFTGEVEVSKNLKIIELGFKNEIEKAMLQALLLVEKSAKQNVPVITGRLRRSIRGGITKIGSGYVEGAVGANTVYAAAVEFGKNKKGGGRTSGKPYLSRAVTENSSKIQQIIQDGLKKTLRGFKASGG